MNIKFLTITILLLIGFGPAKSQNKFSPRETFLEAESFFLYEEYQEALPLYLQLAEKYPLNYNITYRIGMCYLYIPYAKPRSISYLEKAAQNINPRYKGSNLKETGAPPDALFYLGDAYRINNMLEKAISTYKKFKIGCDPAQYDIKMVDDQVRACENAQKLERKPVKVSYTNLGSTVNTSFAESNSVVSGDEKVLVYTEQLQFYPAVFCSRKENGSWSQPLNINPELMVDDDCFPVCLSYDGTEMILYRSSEFLGDLFVSRYQNGKWSKVKKLNANINTKFWESHACLSKDGSMMFFTSNRKESIGGLDIFVTERKDIHSDDWGPARNLGTVVNTPFNEETPFLTNNGYRLYFSSLGHNGMGGYDIFYSEFNASKNSWGEPLNVGYPVNTTDNDLFYQPVGDGNQGYITLANDDSYGKTDLYKVKITAEPDMMVYLNKTLEEPKQTNPTSSINRTIVKQAVIDSETKAFIAATVSDDNAQNLKVVKASLLAPVTTSKDSVKAEAVITDTVLPSPSEKDTSSAILISEEKEINFTPGQQQAWHKLLYGGLGILAVFILFILFLVWRSRKKKEENKSL